MIMAMAPEIWSEVRIPADTALIPGAQALGQSLAAQAGLSARQTAAVELAIEEVITTLLDYGLDPGEQSIFELAFSYLPPRFVVQVHSNGLPFDLSLIPAFDPQDHDHQQTQGLSLFLLKHLVDHYYLKNQGRKGYSFVLEWQQATQHIRDQIPQQSQPPPTQQPTAEPPEPISSIRLLNPQQESISLARLVYRSYGYSYVYEDIYYPERIRANHEQHVLRSWVAVAESGRIAGHVALMRAWAESPAVEWGIAVTDPAWRGQGLMKKLLAQVIDDARGNQTQVLFAHAVTAHPYTQKTALNFGFAFTALLLCYAPQSLSYRGIAENRSQRESTFIATRVLHPLTDQPVYLPAHHASLLQKLAASIGLDYSHRVATTAIPEPHTQLESRISSAVNVAEITLQRYGTDFLTVLAHEQRRLCQEQVDVLLMHLDLTDPSTPEACDHLEQLGFFIAGLSPMQPFAHTLTLQYLNNLHLAPDAITTGDTTASWLKDIVLAEKHRVESHLLHER